MRNRFGRRVLPLVFVLMLLPLLVSGCGNSNGGSARPGDVDVNLSALGTTMLFAEIINIMNNPENYLGQVIKVRGGYFNFFHEESNQYIHFLLILDEAGCCEQGFQFRVSEEFGAPEDLLEIEEEIEIIGIFSRCEGDDWGRYYLEVEELNVL